jgi:hypothetical protein
MLFPLSLAIFSLLPLPEPQTQDMAFSLGTWSFLGKSLEESRFGGPGAFADVGLVMGLTPRFETGLSVIARITPKPIDDLVVEGHIGASIFGTRLNPHGGPALYVNAILDVGGAVGYRSLRSIAPIQSRYVFIRLSPLAIGNSYYGRRDRLFSIAMLYDLDTKEASLSLALIRMDFFIVKDSKFR